MSGCNRTKTAKNECFWHVFGAILHTIKVHNVGV